MRSVTSVLVVTIITFSAGAASAECTPGENYFTYALHAGAQFFAWPHYEGPITNVSQSSDFQTISTTFYANCQEGSGPQSQTVSYSKSKTHSWNIQPNVEAGITPGGLLNKVILDAHVDVGAEGGYEGTNTVTHTWSSNISVAECKTLRLREHITKYNAVRRQVTAAIRWLCNLHSIPWTNECGYESNGTGEGWDGYYVLITNTQPGGEDPNCMQDDDPCKDCYDADLDD